MYIDVSGTRLWLDVDGPVLVPDGPEMRERPTVVLLHGGPGSFDHTYFKPDFARLAEVAQVVYLDLRGHGRSDWGEPADWSFEACADDVPTFCEALGIAAPVVLGHSLGGMVAMLYGARHPKHPGALVLQSTMGRFDLGRTVETFRRLGGDAIAETVQRVYGGKRETVTGEEWERCWQLFGPWVAGELERSRTVANRALNVPGLELMRRLDVLDQLSRIECPTLICVGDLDPITPEAAAREVLDALSDGVGRLAVLAGAGHFPWRDVPDLYWPLVSDFVTGSGSAELHSP